MNTSTTTKTPRQGRPRRRGAQARVKSQPNVFPVVEIRPNPFRDIKRYPLENEKIEALRESIRSTSFWDNIVARIGKDGHPEIAYGHHRLEALRKELGEDAHIYLTIRPLDDAEMLKIMVRENMEDWQTTASGDQACVRAVVEAYSSGTIELPQFASKTPKSKLRYAPSFRQGHVPGRDREDRPYNAATLAVFLGWDRTKVETTLAALELIERESVPEHVYNGLTQRQGRAVTAVVRKVVHAHDAQVKKYEKEVSKARKRAELAETEEERAKYERLAESTEAEIVAVQKRAAEQAAHTAYHAAQVIRFGDADKRAVAECENLPQLPPLPSTRSENSRAFKEDPDWRIADYLYTDVDVFWKRIQAVRPYVESFSPEQMEKAIRGGHVVQGELVALEDALNAVLRERQERGAGASTPFGQFWEAVQRFVSETRTVAEPPGRLSVKECEKVQRLVATVRKELEVLDGKLEASQ